MLYDLYCCFGTVSCWAVRGNPGYSARRKPGRGGFDHESMKPLIGIQLVEVQPGQSRSGQAGSACCAVSGDRWGEAYTARKRAARVQLRNRFFVSVPTPLAWRKAASGRASRRGRFRTDGVPSPGHAFTGIPQEPGRAPYLFPRPGVGPPGGKRTRPEAGGCAAGGSEARIQRQRYRAPRETGGVRDG